MKGNLTGKLAATPLGGSSQRTTYSQRVFNDALRAGGTVSPSTLGFSGNGIVPGGLTQGSGAPAPSGNSYFAYVGDTTYFQVINNQEYYVTT